MPITESAVSAWLGRYEVRIHAQPDDLKRFVDKMNRLDELLHAAKDALLHCSESPERERLAAALSQFE